MPFAEREDLRLYYERSGEGATELLFVHGWCCDHTFWGPQLEHFGPTCRVTTVDLRGCGQSSRPGGGYDIPTLADDLAWLCHEAGIERPVVLGHSLGGMIGVELAARWPTVPSAIVGVDPGPIDYTPATRQIFAALADGIAGPAGRAVHRAYVSEIPGPYASDELRAHIVDTMCAVPLEVAGAVIRGVVEWNGTGALALCEQTPILVIRAGVSTDEPQRLRSLKPDLEYAVTLGAGHFNHLEVPEQVNAIIARFLELRVSRVRPGVSYANA
jgi:pimeloyl-ACP methyl ester carboxylesterase